MAVHSNRVSKAVMRYCLSISVSILGRHAEGVMKQGVQT